MDHSLEIMKGSTHHHYFHIFLRTSFTTEGELITLTDTNDLAYAKQMTRYLKIVVAGELLVQNHSVSATLACTCLEDASKFMLANEILDY